MICVYCRTGQTRVLETRRAGGVHLDDPESFPAALLRRRECLRCRRRFTTCESLTYSAAQELACHKLQQSSS